MSTNWDYEQTAKPLNDTRVDRIGENPAPVIDELPSLAIDIPDAQIIKNLDNRIEDAKGYWDTADGFNLTVQRGDNQRMYLGKQQDVRSLYRFQLPYVENQLYIAIQAVKAYLTARLPQSEVSPAQDSPTSKIFALDLEKIHMAHSQKVNLNSVIEQAVTNALLMRVGFIKFEFDPDFGPDGEVIPTAPNPDHVVVDKNAAMGQNPAFIAHYLKMSVNEACNRWPDKKEEIYKECSIIRGTYKQLEEIIVIREVYLTYYDKQYKPMEALVYYFGNLVLEKDKNPHWLYANAKRNFMPSCKKPWIALNFDNDGSHWIDQTSAIEQAGKIQNVLNKRGRQIMEVVDKANGTLVVSQDSGLTKDDLQNLTGDPNQRLIIKTMGGKTQDMIYQVPPPEIPNFLYQDKLDLRTTIHAIMGTPVEFTGTSNGEDNDETLGEAIMKKDQASGRQDLYVRSIDRFANDYFNMLTQMMVVWYKSDHFFVYNGGDGEFDYLTASRNLFEDGIAVSVKSGSTPPLDKQREEAIALNLAKQGVLSPLDIYKMLHLQNPQKLYDNWAKYKSDPMSLARDSLDDMDSSKAYMAYVEIMNGKTPKDPDDCNKEFVLSLSKLMRRDEFMKKPKKIQTAFLKYVEKAITSLELRTSLDLMSKEGLQLLEPQQPIQPLPPPMPPQMPGMMPGGVPGMPGAGSPPSLPGQVPPGLPGTPPGNPLQGLSPAPPQPPMGQGGPVTNGTPIQNPAAPVTPNLANPQQLPGV